MTIPTQQRENHIRTALAQLEIQEDALAVQLSAIQASIRHLEQELRLLHIQSAEEPQVRVVEEQPVPLNQPSYSRHVEAN